MSRPYHGRRRRRPRRRLRYRGNGLPPRTQYQDFGLRDFYNLFFPHIQGRDRRQLFNGVSGWLALWFGVLGALIGWGCSARSAFLSASARAHARGQLPDEEPILPTLSDIP